MRKITYEIVGECHICTSHAPNSDGYPTTKIDKKTIRLHKLIYEQIHGDIPTGMVVRHTCDNRMCINPEHLILGTVADNNRDRMQRNRSAVGSKNGRSKLTENDVRIIKKSLDKCSIISLAKQFNIDEKVIRLIRDGKIWRHVA